MSTDKKQEVQTVREVLEILSEIPEQFLDTPVSFNVFGREVVLCGLFLLSHYSDCFEEIYNIDIGGDNE